MEKIICGYRTNDKLWLEAFKQWAKEIKELRESGKPFEIPRCTANIDEFVECELDIEWEKY